MRCNQKDTSTFSFKELLEMKEKKPIELMPPPRTPIRIMKDIYQELRKNLTETSANAQQNQLLQDELNKIKLMNKENSFTNSLNNNFNINNNNINNENDVSITDFDTYLNNNSHNLHNDQNLEEDCPLNTSLDIVKEKENYIKFNKFPNPKNKAEIKIFVNNLICYINLLLSCTSIKNNTKFNDELLIFKYKLETRYNDYRNHGLNEQYFINILSQNQEELINKLKENIKSDKKDDNSNNNNNNCLNINNLINVHSNYFMGKKRKKSLSEIKSITDGSSSYDGVGELY